MLTPPQLKDLYCLHFGYFPSMVISTNLRLWSSNKWHFEYVHFSKFLKDFLMSFDPFVIPPCVGLERLTVSALFKSRTVKKQIYKCKSWTNNTRAACYSKQRGMQKMHVFLHSSSSAGGLAGKVGIIRK